MALIESVYLKTEYIEYSDISDLEKKHKEAIDLLRAISNVFTELRRFEDSTEISCWLDENHPELGYCRRIEPLRQK